MLNKALDLYQAIFGKTFFLKFNQLLYMLGLRGIGILNYKNDIQSGEENFIRNHITATSEGVVFDVGANKGEYSNFIKKNNQNIKVFAFEPHPTTYKNLVKNVSNNGIDTFNLAVGSNKGSLILYDYENSDGSEHASLYKDVIEEIHQGKSVSHEVNMITLDDFVAEQAIEKIHLLKIDTEGHELEVLRGFINHIKNNKIDTIHFEFNEMNVASRVFFKDFWDLLPNYKFYRMLPNGLVEIKKYSPLFCEIYAYQNIVAKLKT